MPKAKRALPKWTSEDFVPPYKEGLKHKYLEVPKKTNIKTSPTEYYDKRKKDAIKKVLTTDW